MYNSVVFSVFKYLYTMINFRRFLSPSKVSTQSHQFPIYPQSFLPPPPPPSAATDLTLCLCRLVYSGCCTDSYNMWWFVTGFLHSTFVFEFHLYWSRCQYFTYLDCQIIFHFMDRPHFAYPLIIDRYLGCFHFGAIYI